MSYKLTVKPNDDVLVWLIFADGRPVEGFNRDGEKLLTLADGEHRLTVRLTGPGGEMEIDIAEKPPIISSGVGSSWPVTIKVPDGETGIVDAIYFRTPQ